MKSALVLSGGGAKGMIEVGAVDYLLDMADLEITEVAGISTGALQACIYASPHLRHDGRAIWDRIKVKQIYKRTPLPLAVLGLLRGSMGLYSNDPLRVTLGELITPEKFDCPVRVGYVDLDTGSFCVADSTTLSADDFLDAVWSSTTMPLIWPPVKGRFVDGGIRRTLPMGDMIGRGVERIIGVLCSPSTLAPFDTEAQYRTLVPAVTRLAAEADRVLNIVISQVTVSSLNQVLLVNRLVGEADANGTQLHSADGRVLRHVPVMTVAPAPGTDIGHTLDFSAAWKLKRYLIGQKAAQAALKANPDFA